MSDKVILIIKAANQSSVDQRIECDLDWKILYLKEEISKIHPAKPSIEEQRLIYSGQLLQDAFLLRTVLRHPSENNEYTIHMVCSSLKAASTVKTPQEQSTSYPPPVITNESNSQNESASSSDSTGDGLRHRFQSEQIPAIGVQQQGFNTSALYSPIPQLPPPFQTMADPVQQMAAMQEMYAQYMASYMQYIQSGSLESGRFFQEATPSPPPPTSTGIPAELDNQEVRREPQNQQQQQQQPNNDQEPQRNAQARPNQGMVGEGEEDEMAARDWLDYIYFASRMMVLFSIVYFYSTLTRFLVVTLFALMIYLYQCGCFRMWRNENLVEPPAVQRQQPPGEAAAPEQQQRAAEEQDEGTPPSQAGAATSVAATTTTTTTTTTAQPGPEEMSSACPPPTSSSSNSETLLQQQQQREENERGGDAMEASILERAEEDEEEEEEVQNAPSSSPTPPFPSQAPPPQPPSLLSLMWTFVTTLFTSLLPEQHQPQIL